MLRFFAVWDDRRSLFGDRRPYRVHYFLEDATVEVLETNENNSGRDSFPVFLRRGPLPKVCLTRVACMRHWSWLASLYEEVNASGTGV